jgi:hypothetical protein
MTSISLPTPPRSRGALIWLIVSQVLAALSLLPWLLIAGLSVMAFDAGFSTGAALFVGAIWAYPLLPLVCSVVAWVCYIKHRTRGAVIATSIPMLIVLPLLVYMLSMMAG